MAVLVLIRMTKSSVSRILCSRKVNGVGLYSFKCTVEEYGGSVTVFTSPVGGVSILSPHPGCTIL